MKFIHLGLVFVTVFLGGCATHFYISEENKVTLYLKNLKARNVVFACSLDGFEGQILKKNKGLWTATLPNDKPFRYYYVVDGETFLPPCPLKEKDDFGSANCIFEPEL